MINKENTPYTENYAKDVVQSGDRASGNFNVTCNEANEGLSIREYLQKI
ncbi:MAG: hypothetical protein LBP53_04775 [Candidatus Peribacteria bacterium]|jgi:hypothetical protein|nr:hypothetical protein [Candidatus Peribacteria bacterium]